MIKLSWYLTRKAGKLALFNVIKFIQRRRLKTRRLIIKLDYFKVFVNIYKKPSIKLGF